MFAKILKNTKVAINNYYMGNVINIFQTKNLKKFWNKCNKKKFPKLLGISMDKYINSENYYHTSPAHRFFLIKCLKIIEKNRNFQDARYFQFDNPNFHSEFSDSSINQLVSKKKPSKIFKDLFKIHKNLKISTSLKLNFINYLLYEKLIKNNFFKKIKFLKDKSFIGKDRIYNQQDKIKITQEKLRSLLEYHTISPYIKKKSSILEIGCGGGRICDTILSINKDISKYILVDIPPALFFAYSRLKKSFPKKRIFYGININNEQTLEKIIDEFDIILLFPSQINLIKTKSIDFCLAIDCLHEMNKQTIQRYMKFIDLSCKLFYFKVHEFAQPPFSFNKLSVHNPKSYFINSKWKFILKKKSLFPSYDFECVYKM